MTNSIIKSPGCIILFSLQHFMLQCQPEEFGVHAEEFVSQLLSRFSRVQLCATPQAAAHQAPWSPGFSRQEHWSGLRFQIRNLEFRITSSGTAT